MSQVLAPLFLALVVLASPLGRAAQVSGELQREGRHFYVAPNKGPRLILAAENESALFDLLQLKDGDQLVAYGEQKGGVFRVSEVQFVGLRDLLGYWLSNDLSLVEIVSFSEFKWFKPPLPTFSPVPQVGHYTLAPGEGSWFTLLLVQNDQVTTGRLRYFADKVEVEIWQDQFPQGTLRLTRVSAPQKRDKRR